MKFLIVIDMQNDFIDGVLGTKEAQAIVPLACEKIRNFEGKIIATMDTHDENYLNTQEGKLLPVPHCIENTTGFDINDDIDEAIYEKPHLKIYKHTFGVFDLPKWIKEIAYDSGEEIEAIELIGVCTDICVINNALILKAEFPEVPITVDATCCAGVTPELHKAALEVMKSCQIIVKEG
jgi:nicotinamidase-related amidase